MQRSCPAPTAAIDIGTNTLRLLIGCIQDQKLVRLASDRSVTRLGRDLIRTKCLNHENTGLSMTSLIHFKGICEQYGVRKIIAVGTSALRDAQNSSEFLDKVKQETGIAVEIISGEREADLTLKGVLGFQGFNTAIFPAPFLIVDIGGGSTEWIYCENFKFQISNFKMGSVQVGAVRLSDMFIRHDPPLSDEVSKIKIYIREAVNRSLQDSFAVSASSARALIATGGTATTVAAVDLGLAEYDGDRVHMHRISRPVLAALVEKLSGLPLDQRVVVKGLERGRADIIVPGILILLTIMEMLDAPEAVISDYGILEGILLES